MHTLTAKIIKVLLFTVFMTHSAYANTVNTHFAFSEFMNFNIHNQQPVFLEDIMNKLGDTPIHYQCQSNEPFVSICYKVKGGYIHFISSYPTLSKVALTGFVMDGSKVNKSCSDLSQDVKLDVEGLRIGMSKDEYKNLMNKNNAQWLAKRIDPPIDSNSLEVVNNYTVKYEDKDESDKPYTNTLRICTHIAPKFENDKLIKVTVSTSCP